MNITVNGKRYEGVERIEAEPNEHSALGTWTRLWLYGEHGIIDTIIPVGERPMEVEAA